MKIGRTMTLVGSRLRLAAVIGQVLLNEPQQDVRGHVEVLESADVRQDVLEVLSHYRRLARVSTRSSQAGPRDPDGGSEVVVVLEPVDQRQLVGVANAGEDD